MRAGKPCAHPAHQLRVPKLLLFARAQGARRAAPPHNRKPKADAGQMIGRASTVDTCKLQPPDGGPPPVASRYGITHKNNKRRPRARHTCEPSVARPARGPAPGARRPRSRRRRFVSPLRRPLNELDREPQLKGRGSRLARLANRVASQRAGSRWQGARTPRPVN